MFIIDTDLNFPSDDFQALLLVLTNYTERCLAVTATAGNTWAEEVALNIRKSLGLLGCSDIQIGRGPDFSRFSIYRHHAILDKQYNGRGFIGAHEKAEKPRISSDSLKWLSQLETAPDLLVRFARKYPKQVRILCLGPLTNLYDALAIEPDLPNLVRDLVIMGGRFDASQETIENDFNFWFDETATNAVLQTFSNATIVTKNACESEAIPQGLKEMLKTPSSPLGFFLVDDFMGMELQHGPKHFLWDQSTAIAFLNAGVIESTRTGVKMAPSPKPNSGGLIKGKVVCELNHEEIRNSFARAIFEPRSNPLPLSSFDDGSFYATPRYLHYAEEILLKRNIVALENTIIQGRVEESRRVTIDKPEELLTLCSDLTHLLLGAKERGELWPPSKLADQEVQETGVNRQTLSLTARLAIESDYFARFEKVSLISILRNEKQIPVGFACLSPDSAAFEQYVYAHYNHRVPRNYVITEFGYISPEARGLKGFDFMQRQLVLYCHNGLEYPSDTYVYGEILSSQVGSIKTNERLGFSPLGSYVISEGFEKGRRLTMYRVPLNELLQKIEVQNE